MATKLTNVQDKIIKINNSLVQRYETYASLLTELRARLGFLSQGPGVENKKAFFDSHLRRAHDYVFALLDPPDRRMRTDIILEIGSYQYDWHDDLHDEDIDPSNILSMWIVDGTDIYPLKQGITESMREDFDTLSRPLRFDMLNGQIELYPRPDKNYLLRIEFLRGKPRFKSGNDQPGVLPELVFWRALATAKADLNHQDAQVAEQTFREVLAREKAKGKQLKRYFMNASGKRREFVSVADGVHRLVVDYD